MINYFFVSGNISRYSISISNYSSHLYLGRCRRTVSAGNITPEITGHVSGCIQFWKTSENLEHSTKVEVGSGMRICVDERRLTPKCTFLVNKDIYLSLSSWICNNARHIHTLYRRRAPYKHHLPLQCIAFVWRRKQLLVFVKNLIHYKLRTIFLLLIRHLRTIIAE